MNGETYEGKEDRFSWRERLALLRGKCWELVVRERHDVASPFDVAGGETSTRIDVGFGEGSCVGPGGDTQPGWEIRSCPGWGSGMQSLSKEK